MEQREPFFFFLGPGWGTFFTTVALCFTGLTGFDFAKIFDLLSCFRHCFRGFFWTGEEAAVKEARLEQKLDDLVQERNSIAASITCVVEQAVKDAINGAKYQPVKRVQINDSQMRRESYTNLDDV